MRPDLHGDDAFRNLTESGNWCVVGKRYRRPPAEHPAVDPPSTEKVLIWMDLRPEPARLAEKWFSRATPVKTLVDSRSSASVFTRGAADSLDIIDKVVERARRREEPDDICLLDREPQPCVKYQIQVRLWGGEWTSVTGHWPLDVCSDPDGGKPIVIDLLHGTPDIPNTLGMTGILDRHMLCLTPEKLWVFPLA